MVEGGVEFIWVDVSVVVVVDFGQSSDQLLTLFLFHGEGICLILISSGYEVKDSLDHEYQGIEHIQEVHQAHVVVHVFEPEVVVEFRVENQEGKQRQVEEEGEELEADQHDVVHMVPMAQLVTKNCLDFVGTQLLNEGVVKDYFLLVENAEEEGLRVGGSLGTVHFVEVLKREFEVSDELLNFFVDFLFFRVIQIEVFELVEERHDEGGEDEEESQHE